MDDFLLLCKRFGQLEDLVQGGGGNISVKLSNTHSVIKSSGYALSDVTRDKGFTIFNHAEVAPWLPLTASVVSGPPPSMETHFHVFLRKYVVHLHPTAMLPFLCRANAPECVPYSKPGPDLASEIRERWRGESVIFLKNHGIIVTGDTLAAVLEECANVYDTYRSPAYISLKAFWSVQNEFPDEYVYKVSLAETRAYLPVLRAHNIRNLTPDIALFLRDSVHIDGDHLFIHARTKQKCLAALEILRSYCEVAESCETALNELQVAAVLTCPSEKHRLAIP